MEDQTATIEPEVVETTAAPEPGSLAERIAAAEASVSELKSDVEPKAESAKEPEAKPEEAKAEEKKPEEPKAEEKPKLSRKERRAEWAARNRERIDADRAREFEERLKKLEGSDKPVTKKDFPTEEAYYRYIAQEEMRRMAAMQEQQRQSQADYDKRAASWNEKIDACITDAEKPDYVDAVQDADALAKFLGDDLMAFIESSEVGPRILYSILENPRIAETLKASHPYRAVQMLSSLEAVCKKDLETLQKADAGKDTNNSAEAPKEQDRVQSVAEARPAPRATGALGGGSPVKDFDALSPDEMAATIQRKLRERRTQGYL